MTKVKVCLRFCCESKIKCSLGLTISVALKWWLMLEFCECAPGPYSAKTAPRADFFSKFAPYPAQPSLLSELIWDTNYLHIFLPLVTILFFSSQVNPNFANTAATQPPNPPVVRPCWILRLLRLLRSNKFFIANQTHYYYSLLSLMTLVPSY